MTPEQDYPSNATLLAEIRGLEKLMRVSLENLKEQYEGLSGLPVKVATLESDMLAVKSEQVEIRKDQAEFRAELKQDREGTRGRVVQWLSVAAVGLGVLVSLIFYILQAVGH